MALSQFWTPPKDEEEEKKGLTWEPPTTQVEQEPAKASTFWKPPAPTRQEEEEQAYTQGYREAKVATNSPEYDEPDWLDIAFHSGKSGVADVQSSLLNLGRLLYEGGVQITDKVTDIFDKDVYDPKKDEIRKWLNKLVEDSEKVAEDSFEHTVSKSRLKNIVALAGRAVPLSLLTLAGGGALTGAYPALATKIGTTASHMVPFASTALGGHARKIEQEYEAKYGEEAPYFHQLMGGIMGAAGEVATEAIPFEKWLGLFGTSSLVNRGSKNFLKNFGIKGIEWMKAGAMEAAQEVGMVPIEKSISNLLLSENENIFPIEEMKEAGAVGVAMSLMIGALGSTNAMIRSSAETNLDKVMKMKLTRDQATLNIMRSIAENATTPTLTPENIDKVIETSAHKLIPKFPASEWAVTDQASLERLGNAIKHEVGLDKVDIEWQFSPSQKQVITGSERQLLGNNYQITIRYPSGEKGTTSKYIGGGELLGGTRGPSHGNMTKIILHELGHIAAPPKESKSGTRWEIHHDFFHYWNDLMKDELWTEPEVLLRDIQNTENALNLGIKPEKFVSNLEVKEPVFDEMLYRGINRDKPTDEGWRGRGTYYTPRESEAIPYSKDYFGQYEDGVVIKRRVQLYNPYIWDTASYAQGEDLRTTTQIKLANEGKLQGKSTKEINEMISDRIRSDLESQGYDGIVFRTGAELHEVIQFERVRGTGQEIFQDVPDIDLYKGRVMEVNYLETDSEDVKQAKNLKGEENAEQQREAMSEEGQKAFDSLDGAKDRAKRAGVLENLSKSYQDFLSSIKKSMQVMTPAKDAFNSIDSLFSNKKADEYFAHRFMNNLEQRIKTDADATLIYHWLEQPNEYQAQVEEAGLLDDAKFVQGILDDFRQVAESYDLLDSFIENYAPHAYKNMDKWLKKNYQTVGTPIGGFLGTKFGHAKQRKLSTEEAIELGLEPITDIRSLLTSYMVEMSRAINNKNFIETMKEMRTEEGHPVATTIANKRKHDWANSYVPVDNPKFASWITEKTGAGDITMVPLVWHPSVAGMIRDMAQPTWMQGKAYKSIRHFKGLVKRLIFYNPAIHGWNILSDVLDEMNFNPIATAQAFKKGKEMYTKNPQLTEQAIRDGVNMQLSGSIAQRLRDDFYDIAPVSENLPGPLGKLFHWNDVVLWQDIVRNAQLGLYARKRAEGLTGKEAAVYTNDQLGTLPKHYFSNAEYSVISNVFLARNWTISNLRLLTGALGTKQNIIPIKALKHPGLTAEEMQHLAPHYRFHLFKGVMALLVMANVLTKLTTDHWAWDNDEGHKIDWDTGLKDNKGRKIYVVMPLFRYIRDYIGWGSEPRQTMWNKTEPVLRSSLEALINYSQWRHQPIIREGSSFTEKATDLGKHFVTSLTPLDTIFGRGDEVRTKFEWLLPFTGTWARRQTYTSAATYETMRKDDKVKFLRSLNPKEQLSLFGQLPTERIYGEIAQKLRDFRNKREYADDKLDKEIEKLLMKGEIVNAIELMQSSGRYVSKDAIKTRIMPYVTGGAK